MDSTGEVCRSVDSGPAEHPERPGTTRARTTVEEVFAGWVEFRHLLPETLVGDVEMNGALNAAQTLPADPDRAGPRPDQAPPTTPRQGHGPRRMPQRPPPREAQQDPMASHDASGSAQSHSGKRCDTASLPLTLRLETCPSGATPSQTFPEPGPPQRDSPPSIRNPSVYTPSACASNKPFTPIAEPSAVSTSCRSGTSMHETVAPDPHNTPVTVGP